MQKFVDNTVDLLVLVFEKVEDLILAGAFKFWTWLGRQLEVDMPLVIPVYKDRPETQETLAKLVSDNAALGSENDELQQENDSLRAEAVAYANLIVKEEYGQPKTGPKRPNNNKKLTEREVFEIRNMKRQGWKNSELARAFDVNPATVSRIVRGQYHKKVAV